MMISFVAQITKLFFCYKIGNALGIVGIVFEQFNSKTKKTVGCLVTYFMMLAMIIALT